MGNLIVYYILRIVSCVAQRVPVEFALFLGDLLGLLGYYTVPQRKRIALENLRAALGKERTEKELRRIVWAMGKNLGRNMMEFLRLPVMTPKYFKHYIKIVGSKNLDQVLTRGKGTFVLTAHFGNWDLCAAALIVNGWPTNLVTKYLRNEVVNQLWLSYRSKVKINQLYREGSLREIIRCLNRNELMGFVLDQSTKREEGVFVNFFGRPACTIPGLATLVQRLDTPVIPCFMVRQKGPYHKIILEPPIPFKKCPTMDETIVYNTQVYTNVLERYIRAHPEHWIWMHRRWKTKPLTNT